MMTRWHHSVSSKAMSAEDDSVKKKTLDISSGQNDFLLDYCICKSETLSSIVKCILHSTV